MKRALQISVTTATRLRATVAQPRAELSVDTTAPVARQLPDTPAAQAAETPSSLAARHATTATPTVEMDAVRLAQVLSPDGLAQLSRAVGQIAFATLATAGTPAQGVAQSA